MADERKLRLEKEQRLMEQLAARSEVLGIETENQPADRYVITFTAKLVERANDSTDEIHWTDNHKVELELPWSFPRTAPDVRWLTKFYHPNVSSSGFVSLTDIGLTWDNNMTLDVVTERLWDVARYAWYDLEGASNYSARRWIKGNLSTVLPVDQRTIVPQQHAKVENIISYRKKGESDLPGELSSNQNSLVDELEIIDDSNPGKKTSEKDVVFLSDADIVDAEIVPPKKQGGDDDIIIIE